MSRRLLALACLLPALALAQAPANVSSDYRDAVQARQSGAYMMVIHADGKKALVPVASLRPPDLAWLRQLAETKPLAKGKSSVTVVAEKATVPAKQTIVTSKTENGVETVRLVAPSVLRDQIGGTCMLYARVHWLDIAGHYVNDAAIYKCINGAPPDAPWQAPQYANGLTTIITERRPRPVMHTRPPAADEFNWAREQLRKGRPLLAALPREIWQALPPGFVAQRPWSGGSVGHQIVVNGFTYDAATGEGSFRIVNSWAELPEFDLSLKAAGGGNLVFEASLSRVGEPPEVVVKEVVQRVTFLKSVGSSNLYEVVTNRGTERMLAPSEAAARRLVEERH
ncbi:MAG: hypothetical protein ABII82_16880 [Verrucomicrobiota bacterium]